MNTADLAEQIFREGFSCSQSVLAAFSESIHLDREAALRIAQPFGGGIAQTGQMCGAVYGALMVIGMKYGRIRADDDAAKFKTYEKVKEFLSRFESDKGSTLCRILLGYDLNDPEQLKAAEEAGRFEDFCPILVRHAVFLLDDITD